MQFPQININGTDAQNLFDEALAAATAVGKAREAVGEMTVHGRDYQTLDAAAFSQARKEHRARLLQLDALHQELLDIAQEIARQKQERRRG